MTALTDFDAIARLPPVDRLPIVVRAYVPAGLRPTPNKRSPRKPPGPSEWVLVFDTETTIDAAQALRFGTYQLRRGKALLEAGIFFEPDILSVDEQAVLRAYAPQHDLTLHTREAFVKTVFFKFGYQLRATIVGFNLPFDLSRLAIHHAAARRSARGGFSLQLSTNPYQPRIQIKHLSARASFVQFAAPMGQPHTQTQRKNRDWTAKRRGFFVDVKTLSAALTSQSFSLGRLANHLHVEHRKMETAEHGQRLTETYVAYAVQDVQVTWECFASLCERYDGYRLATTPRHRIYSEASLGKAYLKQMNIQPWRELQPDFPAELLGTILSTYYGGRSEVHLRRVVTQVLYCDFLSMYPTVCTLMGLWRYVIAQRVEHCDATEEIRTMIETVTVVDLQNPSFWPKLTTLVQVQAAGEIFPVRAKYDDRQLTIGLNYLTTVRPLWYTLADVIAAKLLTGRAPSILQAVTFFPGKPQAGLTAIDILGLSQYRVDPYKDDFFRTAIDLRSSVKRERDLSTEPTKSGLDTAQQALKILANATSYGIFVELNVEELNKPAAATCFGPSAEGFPVTVSKAEALGSYFHPLLATLITGAARLLLAVTEHLVVQRGLDWALCDTDSMAIAKPDGMADLEFFSKTQTIVEWFTPLNPYKSRGPLLKIEEVNYDVRDDTKKLWPLFCLAVSAKRYALFNIDAEGRPVLRKAMAHGLGHLLAPYRDGDAPQSLPLPLVSLDEIGVARWQHDLWYRIIGAAIEGHPNQVDLSDLSAFDRPAASRYHATTPNILNWFKHFNEGKQHIAKVKPFNFLLSFSHFERAVSTPAEEFVTGLKTLPRKRTSQRFHPIAPYNADIHDAAETARDRDTDFPIAPEHLQTYRQALAQYHLHPEGKFLNGNFVDVGATVRRHVIAAAVHHIGKEANRWEEQFFLGAEPNAQVEYGFDPASDAEVINTIRSAAKALGQRGFAKRAGVSLRQVSSILTGHVRTTSMTLAKLLRVTRACDDL